MFCFLLMHINPFKIDGDVGVSVTFIFRKSIINQPNCDGFYDLCVFTNTATPQARWH